jgi:hypothetical protein
MIPALLLLAASPPPAKQAPPPPKLELIHEDETIILVLHPFDPELKYQDTRGMPWELIRKDPYVWA